MADHDPAGREGGWRRADARRDMHLVAGQRHSLRRFNPQRQHREGRSRPHEHGRQIVARPDDIGAGAGREVSLGHSGQFGQAVPSVVSLASNSTKAAGGPTSLSDP